MTEPYYSKRNVELKEKLRKFAQKEIDQGAKPVFEDLLIPERWWKPFSKKWWKPWSKSYNTLLAKYRCINDHVSTCVLDCEEGGLKCLECFEWVHYTFPEDKDGPLKETT